MAKKKVENIILFSIELKNFEHKYYITEIAKSKTFLIRFLSLITPSEEANLIFSSCKSQASCKSHIF